MTTTTDFFLTLRGEATVWCSEHDEPVESWQPGPVFKDRAEAEKFIADTREWYESMDADGVSIGPDHCVFRHPEPVR